MIKIFSENKLAIRSFHIYQIWQFIIDNPNLPLHIVYNFRKLSNSDLCRLFLTETRNYEDYIKLESVLNKTKSIYEAV